MRGPGRRRPRRARQRAGSTTRTPHSVSGHSECAQKWGEGGAGGGLTCWGWSILLYRARAAEQQPLALRRQRASRQSGKNDRPSESMPA